MPQYMIGMKLGKIPMVSGRKVIYFHDKIYPDVVLQYVLNELPVHGESGVLRGQFGNEELHELTS